MFPWMYVISNTQVHLYARLSYNDCFTVSSEAEFKRVREQSSSIYGTASFCYELTTHKEYPIVDKYHAIRRGGNQATTAKPKAS